MPKHARSRSSVRTDAKSNKRQKAAQSTASSVAASLPRSGLADELIALKDPGKLKPIAQTHAKQQRKQDAKEQLAQDKLLNRLERNINHEAQQHNSSAPIDRDDMRAEDDQDLDAVDDVVPQALTRKILSAAQEQQAAEAEAEESQPEAESDDSDVATDSAPAAPSSSSRPSRRSQHAASVQLQLEDDAVAAESADDSDAQDDDNDDARSEWRDVDCEDEEDAEDIELTAEEEQSLSMFLPGRAASLAAFHQPTLADLIMEKIAAKEAWDAAKSGSASGTSAPRHTVPPRVQAVYHKIGSYLNHYTSGAIPKAFKIIPTLSNWEEVLSLTQPESWSPQAVSAATRLCAAGLSEKQVEKYYTYVLLPRVRSDIVKNRKLNYHLYVAVKASLFKPTAFFKGFLLPLVTQDCSVREAIILSSLVNKCSIPVIHSAVAILKICQQCEYSGPVCLMLKTLLNKKYSLPYKVIDELCIWFESFSRDSRQMPLIWHQTLLAFVQRYKTELTEEQRLTIRQLLRKQSHHAVSEMVKREIVAGQQLSQQKQQQQADQQTASAQLNPKQQQQVSMQF